MTADCQRDSADSRRSPVSAADTWDHVNLWSSPPANKHKQTNNKHLLHQCANPPFSTKFQPPVTIIFIFVSPPNPPISCLKKSRKTVKCILDCKTLRILALLINTIDEERDERCWDELVFVLVDQRGVRDKRGLSHHCRGQNTNRRCVRETKGSI